MAKKNKLGATYKNFKEIRNRLERSLRGVTTETEDILLPKDTGDSLDDSLSSIIRTYAKGENAAISDINGRYDADTNLGDFIDLAFSSDRYKDVILNTIMNNTIDKIIEQQFMIRNMPQINKVIKSMTDAIMSPSTQSKDTNDICIRHAEYSATDVREVLRIKKFNEKDRKCVINALSYGGAFMSIYPYKEMACDILTNANIAHKQGYRDPNLFVASQLSDTDKEMAKQLYGEAWYKENIELAYVHDDSTKLFSEADINKLLGKAMKTDDDTIKTFSESINTIHKNMSKDIDVSNDLDTYVETKYFTESMITSEAAHDFKERLFSEAGSRQIDVKRMKNLNGAYVKALEPEKSIGVYVNDELVGVYYVDYDTDFSNPQHNFKRPDRYNGRRKLTSMNTVGINADIKESISNVLKRQLDEKFLTNNKHVLASVDKIIRDTRLETMADTFKIRWIPKKYIVEYANHDRMSQIAMVEPLIICWIVLFRHYTMKKIFYEKDIRYIKYMVSESDDSFGNQGFKALQAVRTMIPAPADILNYRSMNSSQIAGNRVAIPMTRDGTTPFTLERIEGQKPGENDFEDLIKLQAIITEEVGLNWNTIDPNNNPTVTATQIIATQEDKAEMIINKQIQFNQAKNEAVNKIMEYETGLKDLNLTVKYPELKVVKNGIFSDAADKINTKLESIMTNGYTTLDDATKAYVREELYKYYMADVIDTNLVENLIKEYKFKKEFDELGVPAAGGSDGGEE